LGQELKTMKKYEKQSKESVKAVHAVQSRRYLAVCVGKDSMGQLRFELGEKSEAVMAGEEDEDDDEQTA